MNEPVFVVLSPAALATARSAVAGLGTGTIHGLSPRVAIGPDGADQGFVNTLAELAALFSAGRTIVAVAACGIVVRALGPLLADKRVEPPVVVLAEDGSSAVPLLGGHHGANALAARLAELLGGGAAVTTAGDLAFDLALDAPPPGWRLANPVDAKGFTGDLLAGRSCRLEGEAPWLAQAPLPWRDEADHLLVAGIEAKAGDARTLVYHPQALALGLGCERGAPPEEVLELAWATLAEAGLAPGAVAVVVSLDLKADEPAVHHVAEALGVPARFFPAERLEVEAPRLATPSEVVFAEVGCHGVAEGAALAAVGALGRLIAPKRRSARATAAVALAPAPIVAEEVGRARGRLSIIGIGPGAPGWRTGEVDRWIAGAEDLVGYHLYLDLLGPLANGKRRHGYAMGAETERCRGALDLAALGRRVALVSSGDAGIYAMATLIFELMEREADPAWARVEIAVSPGISAMQAAAARVGAPLGHDFCALSLSDLLTPWPVIERRIHAAAAGDFVVAVYNPVSQRRTTQLGVLRRVMLEHRAPETPVVLARNLGREEETVRVITLDALDAKDVDMLTVVLIGSSETRRVGSWVYTPRGYAAKGI